MEERKLLSVVDVECGGMESYVSIRGKSISLARIREVAGHICGTYVFRLASSFNKCIEIDYLCSL